ncbi:MAG TPA: ABC transporter ATP-binding protein [Actinomycetota bacterium]|nr:ABC transporter ATP-binding protein [Actinomycetota bacterium]
MSIQADPALPGTTHPPTPQTAPAFALQVRGLRKVYGEKVAVQALDLDIPAASFFGLVGPNGAGKTTTLRMCTGLLKPDAGQVWVNGIDVWHDLARAKAVVGVLPEDLRLFERLTGVELLTFTGLLRGLPEDTVKERSNELLDAFGLTDAAGTLVIDYSHGMRKKIGLAAALLHGPRVLFLDEPFEAVDPVSALAIRQVLERHIRSGATVVFSSHVMDLVERLCDRVAIVHQGRIVAQGPIDDVKNGHTLEETFVRLVGGDQSRGGELGWLGTSSA